LRDIDSVTLSVVDRLAQSSGTWGEGPMPRRFVGLGSGLNWGAVLYRF
jgi:hypothetical protein